MTSDSTEEDDPTESNNPITRAWWKTLKRSEKERKALEKAYFPDAKKQAYKGATYEFLARTIFEVIAQPFRKKNDKS